jgi:hypothetical protein
MLVICFHAMVGSSMCDLFNLDDGAPWLTSNGKSVRWSGGWDALMVADSCCTRVNARGIYAKPSHWTPRDLSGHGWASVPCMSDGGGGLCVADFGIVFPSAPITPRYNASVSWGGTGCSRARDGRALDPGYGYDVSACDVLDGGGDVVVCGRVASFRRTAVSTEVYWTLCILAVFIVRSLSYLVVQRVKGNDAPAAFLVGWDNLLTVSACVSVLPLALAPDGDSGFVTVEERFFFVTMCCYAGAYAALFAYYSCIECRGENSDSPMNNASASHDASNNAVYDPPTSTQDLPAYSLTNARDTPIYNMTAVRDPPIYNMIAATLQIIASRLYLSAETPYSPVIIWAVTTRALLKLRTGVGFASSLTTFVDSIVLSLMCVLGFGHSHLYLAALFTLSMATSDALD